MAGIVAVGGSHGGVHALRTTIAALPADFPASSVMVLLSTGRPRQEGNGRAAQHGCARPGSPHRRWRGRSCGAIGVILSGSLNDGTTGLYEIKRYGNLVVVQDPTRKVLRG